MFTLKVTDAEFFKIIFQYLPRDYFEKIRKLLREAH